MRGASRGFHPPPARCAGPLLLALAFAVGALLASPHSTWAAATTSTPLKIVAVTPVLAEIATAIGGPDAEVHGLAPAASDPHSFEPTPRDIRRCIEADLVIVSGLGLEPYLERIVAHAGIQGRLVIAADALEDPVRLNADDADDVRKTHDDHSAREDASADGIDPHWWHSPAAVRAVSAGIAQAMIALRPEAATAIAQRLDAWNDRLLALEHWAKAQVARLPPERRQLVTAHNAFGWLARDLGFAVHPIKGPSAEAEPSGRQMAALIDLIRGQQIPAIFAEHADHPRLIEALVAETGARLGGTLYADGPGAPGSGVDTYEAMYRHNITTIVEALGGAEG